MKTVLGKTLAAVLSVFALILIILSLSACGTYYGTYSDGVLGYTAYGNGVTVVCCAEEAEEVEIPSTFYCDEKSLPVTAISSRAFSKCSNLKKVKIPASVVSIEQSAFTGCLNITDLEISQDNPVYRSAGNCIIETESKTLLCGFPSSVIPADGSVEYIGGSAFYGCTGIEEVIIPASVTQIGSGAFEGCADIKSYSVENGNSRYSCADGILYNFERTEILAVPPKIGGEINVPDGVEKLEDNAFNGRSGITKITLPKTLKSIGANAFSGISAYEIKIPDSVTKIGEGAFSKCANLKSLEIPFVGSGSEAGINYTHLFGNMFGKEKFAGGVRVTQNYSMSDYSSYTGNRDYYLPEGLASVTVGGGRVFSCAFLNCKNIREITLRKGVTQIDAYAFYESALNKLVIENEDLVTVGETFTGLETVTNATLPAGLLENFGEKNLKKLRFAAIFGKGEIADKQFENSSLERIVLAEGITKIGCSAFSGSKLKSVSIAESVEQIGNSAFQNCTLLESVTLPSKIKKIDIFTFKGCTSLETLTFPEGLTEISANSVENCTSLKSITIPESVEYIGGGAFGGCSSLEEVNFNAINCAPTKTDNSWVFKSCNNLSIVKIGENVLKIPARLFGFCRGLCEISGGKSVNFIGKNAFYGCTSLKSIEFSNELTTIDEQAFYGCTALESIKINAKEVNNYAFLGCSSLKTVILGSATQSIREYVFKDCALEKIFYEGTSNEWYEVYKSFGFDTASANATIYFYAENPPESGNFWRYIGGLPVIW